MELVAQQNIFRTQNHIDGEWVAGAADNKIFIINPLDVNVLGIEEYLEIKYGCMG